METETSFYWTHMSRFDLKMVAEFTIRNVVFQIKDRNVNNVLNCDSYVKRLDFFAIFAVQ
jgi:hypothetical protein